MGVERHFQDLLQVQLHIHWVATLSIYSGHCLSTVTDFIRFFGIILALLPSPFPLSPIP